MSVPSRPALSRRRALAAALGTSVASWAGLSGCTPNSARSPARRAAQRQRPAIDPDVALAATVLADERAMLAVVEATLAAYPALGGVLRPARDVHQAHIDLLEDAVPDELAATAPTDPSPSQLRGHDADQPVRVPRDRRRAVLALVRREEELALVDKRSAFAAESGAFARVLASMAASAGQQATILRQSTGRGGAEA